MPVFINEFHYDNIGTDSGERIEVVVTDNTDISTYSVVRYNGGSPTAAVSYGTTSLSPITPTIINGIRYYVINFPADGLQNGSNDGFALVNNGVVVQLLSYEGIFTVAPSSNPASGPAAGQTSVDVGFAESNTTTPVGFSIQLTGTGEQYSDFTWTAAASNTFGAANNGQAFANATTDVGTFAIGDFTANEGNSGTTSFNFIVTRTGNTTGAADIAYAVSSTQASGSDFVGGALPSGTVSFAAGETRKTVVIEVAGDTIDEPTEAFTVTISSPTPGATIGDAEGLGTIQNDDAVVPQPGALSIGDASVVEGNAGTNAISFTVTRSGGSDGAVTAAYDVAFGSASAGDFASGQTFSGTASFANGETSRTIVLSVAGDTAVETDETFTVTLSAPTGGATLADATGIGTIVNDDVPSLSVGDVQVTEGNDGMVLLTYTVTASAPAPAAGISFTISTADGTATAASGDYGALSATGSIAAGQTAYTFSIAVNGDVVAEANETVLVNLSNVTGATIADGQGVGTIINDDGIPANARLFSTDFTGFTAAGFAPNPGAGQLDSDVFRIIGLSDNANPSYGFTNTAGDFARGVIAGSADPTGGGVYSPSANPALVIQPTGSDFVDGAGAIEARIQNTSGFTAVSFDVAFDWTFRNTGDRASGLQLSYSTDGATFTDVPQSAFVTPATSDAQDAATFSTSPVQVTLGDIAVANGGFLYLRWNNTGSTGGGNRDEVGIDNVTVDASLSDASVLTFTDMTVTEGDDGASIATFTVTRTNGAGEASIAYATADGTARAGSDYIAQSGTFAFADGETTKQILIPITGDVRNEADEAFFINFSGPTGVLLPDAQARVTIVNNDTGPVAISDIQGAGHRSSFAGLSVTTTGIVTAIDSNGFYIQDAAGDGDIATSDGIFVFTSATPPAGIAVGDSVRVVGTVNEFVGGTGSLSVTQIIAPTYTVLSQGNDLPAATIIGIGGRLPPTANYEDDNFTSFDPATDGLDFYESMEGMRVSVQAPLVVSNTTDDGFRETFVVASGGDGATGINARGGITVSAGAPGSGGDFNPERIQIDVDAAIFAAADPLYSQGDRLGDVTGILNYAFSTYEVIPTAAVIRTSDVTLLREDSFITGGLPDQLTIATYNLENLDPLGDDDTSRFSLFANDIVYQLNAPDIIGVQEIQDADGAGNGTNLSGTVTANLLIQAIRDAGGPEYAYIEVAPTANNMTGGEPNGNIRNGYFYRVGRVTVVEGSVTLIDDPAFNNSRRPLVAEFLFNGETVTVINAHSTSRGGSNNLQGATQPPNNAGDGARTAQAQAIRDFIDARAAAPGADAEANTVALGDFNGFYFEEALGRLQAGGALNNLFDLLPVEERYSFLFEGNLQPLDNILVSGNLLNGALFDPVHLNTEQPEGSVRPTDHDPLLAALRITADDVMSGTTGNDTRVSGSGDDFFFLQQGGDDTASGGADNDAFYFGAALSQGDNVDGGNGADVVALQGNYAGYTLGSGNLVNVETLSILTGADARFGDTANNRYSYNITSIDANVAAGTQLKVNASTLLAGENLVFDGSAETDGSFLIYGGMGTDTLTGGAGADVFFMAENRFGASDRFVGGAGADILVLRGDYNVTLAADTLTGIETVTLMSAADTRFFAGGTRYSYDVTSNDGNVAAGATLTINGGQLRVGETMSFDGTAETDGAFRIFGGADTDVLRGGAGNDLIFGGLGADTLAGGGGNDVFRYQSAAESTSAGRDGIQDFGIGDLIDLSRIDAIAGTPENDAFRFVEGGVFTGEAGQVIATQGANGSPIWTVQGDIDGDGVSDIEFVVTVTDNHPLTASDFIV